MAGEPPVVHAMVADPTDWDDVIALVRRAWQHGHESIAVEVNGKLYSGMPAVVLTDIRQAQANHRIATSHILKKRAEEMRVKLLAGGLTPEETQAARALAAEAEEFSRKSKETTAEMGAELEELSALISTMAQEVEVKDCTGKERLYEGTPGEKIARYVDEARVAGRSTHLASTICAVMERQYSFIFDKCYPRQYENVGGYFSPKLVSALLANSVAEVLKYGPDRATAAYRQLIPALTPMIARRMPMFFIAPDLMEAVLRTDFDGDIDWVNMKLPYEEGIFVLPRGALSHAKDGEVTFVVWSRKRPGLYPAPVAGIPQSVYKNTCFAILGCCPESGIWYDSVLTAEVRPILRLNNLFYRGAGDALPELQRVNPVFDVAVTEEDAAFIERLGVVCVGTLIAMNARPELLERGKMLKRVPAKGDRPVREFWLPNVIGSRYKLKKEVPKVVDGRFVFGKSEHGTHASPRMHWRRGHFRGQHYGPGNKELKTIWIEPCLVAAVIE